MFRHKTYCAINWAKEDILFKLQRDGCRLSNAGTNGEERNQHALAIVWRDVAKEGVFKLIRYVRNIDIDV